jgi:hypothetical protein
VYHYEFTFFYNGIESQASGKVRIIRAWFFHAILVADVVNSKSDF